MFCFYSICQNKVREKATIALTLLLMTSYGQNQNPLPDKKVDWVIQTNLIRPVFGDAELGILRKDSKARDFLVFGRRAWHGMRYTGSSNQDISGFSIGAQYRFRIRESPTIIKKKKDYNQYLTKSKFPRSSFFWGPYFEYFSYSGTGPSPKLNSSWFTIKSKIPIPDEFSSKTQIQYGLIAGYTIVNRDRFYFETYVGAGLNRQKVENNRIALDYDANRTYTYNGGEMDYDEYNDSGSNAKIGLSIGLKIK